MLPTGSGEIIQLLCSSTKTIYVYIISLGLYGMYERLVHIFIPDEIKIIKERTQKFLAFFSARATGGLYLKKLKK